MALRLLKAVPDYVLAQLQDDLIKSATVNDHVPVNDGDACIDLALQGFGIIQRRAIC